MTKVKTSTAVYRVTYVDNTLREAFVNAASQEEAEEVARTEFENAEHHHAIDTWNDDWCVQEIAKAETIRPSRKRPCWECNR